MNFSVHDTNSIFRTSVMLHRPESLDEIELVPTPWYACSTAQVHAYENCLKAMVFWWWTYASKATHKFDDLHKAIENSLNSMGRILADYIGDLPRSAFTPPAAAMHGLGAKVIQPPIDQNTNWSTTATNQQSLLPQQKLKFDHQTFDELDVRHLKLIEPKQIEFNSLKSIYILHHGYFSASVDVIIPLLAFSSDSNNTQWCPTEKPTIESLSWTLWI